MVNVLPRALAIDFVESGGLIQLVFYLLILTIDVNGNPK